MFQVVCGSKYLVRGETARDHVDLLVSSRFWPPVYVADCAQKVAVCADVLYPELASQMWGRNQGCFSDPLGAAEVSTLYRETSIFKTHTLASSAHGYRNGGSFFTFMCVWD